MLRRQSWNNKFNVNELITLPIKWFKLFLIIQIINKLKNLLANNKLIDN